MGLGRLLGTDGSRTLRRAAPYLLAVAAAVASVLALLPEPPEGAPPPRADYVIMVGVPGLRWDDIDRVRTPTLWKLAERGTIGALAVHSAAKTTCPADGWVTLGAGNRAMWTTGTVDGVCPPLSVEVDMAAGPQTTVEASVADQRDVVRDNRTLPWEVQPGALAEAVRCTTAVGPGAAIAAARPYGRVDRYLPAVGAGLSAQLKACSLAIVDAGTVTGEGPARRSGAGAADATLARILAARPDRSLVIVAGLSDTATVGRLHVAIADGPGYRGGWLTSSTTGRPGYAQLVDLAPTALVALDRPVPDDLFVGAAVDRAGDRPGRLAQAVDQLADADWQAKVQRVVAARFLVVLAIGQILLFGLVTVVLRRARPAPGRSAPPLSRRVRRAAEILLIAAALAIPAALLADLVPWWRWRLSGAVFAGVTALVLAAVTTVVFVLTRRGRATAGMGAVAALAAVAVAADVMTGSRLQLNGVAGYSAATGGRYVGLGTIGLGVLVGGALILAGVLAAGVSRAWRPCVVAAVGAVGIVVVGSPYLGADAAGAVALSAGVSLAAAASSGGWFSLARLASAIATAAVVTTGFAMLDLSRPAEQRSNVGQFLVDLSGGTQRLAGQRIGAHNVTTIATSPLSLLTIGSVVFVVFVLLRPKGGLRRLFGLYPAIRATLGGIWGATALAGLVEGVGFNVLGAASATAVPLIALGALRVVTNAGDPTEPGGTFQPESPQTVSERCDTTPPSTRDDGEVLA